MSRAGRHSSGRSVVEIVAKLLPEGFVLSAGSVESARPIGALGGSVDSVQHNSIRPPINADDDIGLRLCCQDNLIARAVHVDETNLVPPVE